MTKKNPEAELEKAMRRLRWPWPMKGVERKAALFIVLALGSGIGCTLYTRDWAHFGASGGLLVIIGIWLAHRDLVGAVGRVEKLYLGPIEEYRKKLAAAEMKSIVGKVRQEGRVERLKKDEEVLKGLVDGLRYRIRTIEALILAFGTFIWAYGEMIASSLWPL